MSESKDNQTLREEFNRWAEEGRGEGMEEDHLPITLPVLDLMQLSSEDNVLDVGCGAGWLDRILIQNGVSVTEIRADRDVLFDGTGPDPSEENLAPLKNGPHRSHVFWASAGK